MYYNVVFVTLSGRVIHYCVVENLFITILCTYYRETTPLRLSNNSEANASGLPENLECY